MPAELVFVKTGKETKAATRNRRAQLELEFNDLVATGFDIHLESE